MIKLQTKDLSNQVIYSKTPQFLSSNYCKGNIGLNNKQLSQNNTGTYFESLLKLNLKNITPTYSKLVRIDGSTYNQDIETSNSIISCKVQETQGTAWQKLILELLDLLHIHSQTNKKVIMVVSDYSWHKYFYKIELYVNKLNLHLSPKIEIELFTESSFKKVIKQYD